MLVACINHVIVIIQGVRLMVINECKYNDSLFNWWHDNACFIMPNKKAAKLIVFVIAYVLYDTTIYAIFATNNKAKKLIILHHVLMFIVYMLVLFIGGGLVWAAIVILVGEIAAVFSNLRMCFEKEELETKNILDHHAPLCITLSMTASWTIFRLFWYPLPLCLIFYNIKLTKNVLPVWRNVCQISFFLIASCLVVMTYFWYMQMVKGTYKIFVVWKKRKSAKKETQ